MSSEKLREMLSKNCCLRVQIVWNKKFAKGAVGSCQDLNLILNKCQLATVNLWWFI